MSVCNQTFSSDCSLSQRESQKSLLFSERIVLTGGWPWELKLQTAPALKWKGQWLRKIISALDQRAAATAIFMRRLFGCQLGCHRRTHVYLNLGIQSYYQDLENISSLEEQMNQTHIAFNEQHRGRIGVHSSTRDWTDSISIWQCEEEAFTDCALRPIISPAFLFFSYHHLSSSISHSILFPSILKVFLSSFWIDFYKEHRLAESTILSASYMLRLFSAFHFISMSLYSFYFTCE